jgi:hypothetical protein
MIVRSMSRGWLVGLLLCALVAAPRAAQAQDSVVSLDLVVGLLQAGFSGPAVLKEIEGKCIDFQVQSTRAQQQLRAAGADDEFLRELGRVCVRGAPPAAAPRTGPSPQGAALRSLLVPGLGQFSSRRPAVGAVFLGAAAGALVIAAASEEVTVLCAERTTGDCPDNQVIRRDAEPRPELGVLAFLGVAVASAIEAYANAGATPARSAAGTTEPGGVRPVFGVSASPDGVTVELLRLRF